MLSLGFRHPSVRPSYTNYGDTVPLRFILKYILRAPAHNFYIVLSINMTKENLNFHKDVGTTFEELRLNVIKVTKHETSYL